MPKDTLDQGNKMINKMIIVHIRDDQKGKNCR